MNRATYLSDTIRVITITRQNMMKRNVVNTVEATKSFAKDFVKELHGGDVVALSGNLGSGKTTFTQGLARALGITAHLTSPTFVLMNIYEFPKPVNGISSLCHIDVYRLESAKELQAIGAEEYIGKSDTLTIIEWPEKVKSLLPKDALWISFEHDDTLK